MPLSWKPYLAAGIILLFTAGAIRAADQLPPSRLNPRVNYALHCQGCHLPDGSGMLGKVPNMKGHLDDFLRVSGGREYIVQVPGAATARLDDADLATLMNWLVVEMGPAVPAGFKPYTAEELGPLRARWLHAPTETRRHLIEEIERLDEHASVRSSPRSTMDVSH